MKEKYPFEAAMIEKMKDSVQGELPEALKKGVATANRFEVGGIHHSGNAKEYELSERAKLFRQDVEGGKKEKQTAIDWERIAKMSGQSQFIPGWLGAVEPLETEKEKAEKEEIIKSLAVCVIEHLPEPFRSNRFVGVSFGKDSKGNEVAIIGYQDRPLI